MKGNQETNNLKNNTRKSEIVPKLCIFGDSHTRDLQKHISSNTKTFVCYNPGAETEYITNTVQRMAKTVNRHDSVVIMAGSNDISSSSTKYSQKNKFLPQTLRKLQQSINAQKVMIVTIPHRYDLHPGSFINR